MNTKAKRRSTAAIHARIRKRRKELGMNQEELGALAVDANGKGVDKTSVSHWETGLARPGLDRLPAVAAALQYTVDELIDEPKPPIESTSSEVDAAPGAAA